MEMGVTESRRVIWILQERKIKLPFPSHMVSLLWRTNNLHKLNEIHQAYSSGFKEPALYLMLVSTVTMKGIELRHSWLAQGHTSFKSQDRNSSQIL